MPKTTTTSIVYHFGRARVLCTHGKLCLYICVRPVRRRGDSNRVGESIFYRHFNDIYRHVISFFRHALGLEILNIELLAILRRSSLISRRWFFEDLLFPGMIGIVSHLLFPTIMNIKLVFHFGKIFLWNFPFSVSLTHSHLSASAVLHKLSFSNFFARIFHFFNQRYFDIHRHEKIFRKTLLVFLIFQKENLKIFTFKIQIFL